VTLSLGSQAGIWHVPIGVTMAITRSALEQVKQAVLSRAPGTKLCAMLKMTVDAGVWSRMFDLLAILSLRLRQWL
jgi:hypothetical protein